MEKFLLSILLFVAFYYLPTLIVKIFTYFKSKKQPKGD